VRDFTPLITPKVIAANMPMIAMTVSSSMSVNALAAPRPPWVRGELIGEDAGLKASL
jgi:hypothetical protein